VSSNCAIDCSIEKTSALASVARLSVLDDSMQERLINWGYVMCDVALRVHVDASLPLPSGFPYPAVGVG